MGAYKIVGAMLGLVVVVGLFGFIYMLTTNQVSIGYNQGYEPDQPIPFSHKQHAGEYQINCKYCHTASSEGRHAAVPSLNICMNCHTVVKPGSPHIQKLTEAYNSGKPIEWQKVHLLPDHVKFNHSAHVRAGKTCQTCHGPVETMAVVEQWSSLSMGWCVNCHRQPENNASINCGTCHY